MKIKYLKFFIQTKIIRVQKNIFYNKIKCQLKQKRCKQKHGDIFVNIKRDITSVFPQPLQYTPYYISLYQ